MPTFAVIWYEVIPICLLIVCTPVVLKWVLFDCMAIHQVVRDKTVRHLSNIRSTRNRRNTLN
jgi:hypothetical protein